MRAPDELLRLTTSFEPSAEEAKSRELILAMLEHSPEPFSRRQFKPGHITCTALVVHPDRTRILLAYHHRLRRWLLPGGHVEEIDESLADTARREALEETSVEIQSGAAGLLVGMDVHGIPANKRKKEPFHLHHDLIFAFPAASEDFRQSEEAPEIVWCSRGDLAGYGAPLSIVLAAGRALEQSAQ